MYFRGGGGGGHGPKRQKFLSWVWHRVTAREEEEDGERRERDILQILIALSVQPSNSQTSCEVGGKKVTSCLHARMGGRSALGILPPSVDSQYFTQPNTDKRTADTGERKNQKAPFFPGEGKLTHPIVFYREKSFLCIGAF